MPADNIKTVKTENAKGNLEKELVWSIIGQPPKDITGAMACFGLSISQDYHKGEQLRQIVSLATSLGLSEDTVYLTPGILERYNIAIQNGCTYEQVIDLAKGPLNCSLFMNEAKKIEAEWRSKYANIVSQLNTISAEQIISNSHSTNSKLDKIFYKKYNRAWRVILDEYRGSTTTSKKNKISENKNQLSPVTSLAEELIKTILDKNNESISFWKSVNKEALRYLKRRYENYVKQLENNSVRDGITLSDIEVAILLAQGKSPINQLKIDPKSNQLKLSDIEIEIDAEIEILIQHDAEMKIFLANHVEQINQLKNDYQRGDKKLTNIEIKMIAAGIYLSKTALICAILYKLEELTLFYILAKKLEIKYFIYPGDQKATPGVSALKSHIMKRDPTVSELFNWLGLKQVSSEEREQLDKKMAEQKFHSQFPPPNSIIPVSISFPPTYDRNAVLARTVDAQNFPNGNPSDHVLVSKDYLFHASRALILQHVPLEKQSVVAEALGYIQSYTVPDPQKTPSPNSNTSPTLSPVSNSNLTKPIEANSKVTEYTPMIQKGIFSGSQRRNSIPPYQQENDNDQVATINASSLPDYHYYSNKKEVDESCCNNIRPTTCAIL